MAALNQIIPEEKNNYYLVQVKGGHVGRNKYMPVTFAIRDNSAKSAAERARLIGRTKHHHRFAILSVEETTPDKFYAQVNLNKIDPYFNVRSKREQKAFNDVIMPRVRCEEAEPDYKSEAVSKRALYSKKEKIRKPKVFARLNAM